VTAGEPSLVAAGARGWWRAALVAGGGRRSSLVAAGARGWWRPALVAGRGRRPAAGGMPGMVRGETGFLDIPHGEE
jgi:hypothetical protein